jgi:acyl-CoA thioesterase-2
VSPSTLWTNNWGAAYGGYVAGLVIHALEAGTPVGQQLTVVQLSFLRKLAVDRPAQLRCSVLHAGSSATAMQGALEQDGQSVAVALGRSTVTIDQPSSLKPAPAGVPAPENCERRRPSGRGSAFLETEFDLREVPTPAMGTTDIQWTRLPRLGLGPHEAWPAAALALVADMAGAGTYRAIREATGVPHAQLALDLTLHITDQLCGPWALSVASHSALAGGRGVGHADIYDARGRLVASATQSALVRPFRPDAPTGAAAP